MIFRCSRKIVPRTRSTLPPLPLYLLPLLHDHQHHGGCGYSQVGEPLHEDGQGAFGDQGLHPYLDPVVGHHDQKADAQAFVAAAAGIEHAQEQAQKGEQKGRDRGREFLVVLLNIFGGDGLFDINHLFIHFPELIQYIGILRGVGRHRGFVCLF